MRKVAVFGCKTTTLFLLDALRDFLDVSVVVTISPQMGSKAEVADYADVRSHCEKHGIDCYTAASYSLKNEADQKWFAANPVDVGFVAGWQRLLPAEVLATFSVGVFGMHGSADDLPIGRGRSPMNWALLEGRTHFFTNLFKYDPGVDSGDVLDTFVFSIKATDTAETMHFKNVLAMKALVQKNEDVLMRGTPELKRQRDDLTPTYYPKRSPADSEIDWSSDVGQIEAHIRAVAPPFNGAFSAIGGANIRILRAAIFETDLVDSNRSHCRPDAFFHQPLQV